MSIIWSKEIIHNVPEALFVVDAMGFIVWCNDRVDDLLGYKREELRGRSVDVLLAERFRQCHFKHRHNYSQSPSTRPMGANQDLFACDKLGRNVPVDIALSHLHRDGKLWVLVALRSDAIQRERRNLIKKQEEFLTQSQAIGHIGSWDLCIADNHLEWSDEVYRIFGIKPNELVSTYDQFLDCIHPEDLGSVKLAVTAAINTGRSYSIEHRVVRQSGEIRYVVEHGKLTRNNDDQALRMRGTVQDITAERESRERLLLSRAVFDNSVEGIAILDKFFSIIEANSVFQDLVDMSTANQNQSLNQFMSSQSPTNSAEIMRALKQCKQWKGEVWIETVSRDLIPTLATIVEVNEEDSKCGRYVATLLDITDLKESENQLKFLANYDQLTGLPNRALYLQHLEESTLSVSSTNDELAVFYIDLDGFKKINDSQGHDVGDQLLKEIAAYLNSISSQFIFSARLGGDEFSLIVVGKSSNLWLTQIAKNLLDNLKFSKRFDDCILEVSVCVGIARYRQDSLDYMDLMQKSGQAMYQAKAIGSGTYCFYDAAQGQRELNNIKLASDLREGLDDGQYELHYQPQVCLNSTSLVGFEALIRWRHPSRGIVNPDDFIPLAETTGLIIPIGLEVLNQACSLMQRSGMNPTKVAINLSAKQLHSRSLLGDIQNAIDEFEIDPGKLEIEITESVAMFNVEANIAILRGIKSLGVSIAIDDFGTGYSSLSYLKQLPVDILKIDRSFVSNLVNSCEDRAIVTAIITLAQTLNLSVVAEGVENISQLCLLRSMECDVAQGFLFGKPTTESELPAMLMELSVLVAGLNNKESKMEDISCLKD